MDGRAKSKSDQSLCEKSMKVVTNIIRLSSFSLAQKTLGVTGKGAKDVSGSGMVPEKEPLVSNSEVPKSRKSTKQSRPNPIIVIEPETDNGSSAKVSNVTREEGIDRLATDFIEKMRKQLSCVAN